jgi:hypothetical protein
VRRETRAEDDGYRSRLVPGLHARADAERLADEIAFSYGRLIALAVEPVGRYAEAKALAASDIEQATWMCFEIAVTPSDADHSGDGAPGELAGAPGTGGASERGGETREAYRNWIKRSGGSQAEAFRGDPSWTPERRFERLFERLALPAFPRRPRYELLVTLGRLGLYDVRAGSLQLVGAGTGEDETTLAAKRIFAIGDPLLLERRAAALAGAIDVPIEALDLALANWAAPRRITLGFPADVLDEDALARAGDALGL